MPMMGRRTFDSIAQNVLSKIYTAIICGTNGTTIGIHMQIDLEMVVSQIKISRVTYGAFGGGV